MNSGNNSILATLTDNIDLSEFCHAADTKYTNEVSWTPIGNSDNSYQGTFDGNGKIIRNLYISATSDNTAFFGYAEYGSIKNITFDNANVKSTYYYTGILAGRVFYENIENVKTLSSCSVEGVFYTGGIAGTALYSNICNSENHAVVKGSGNVGGIAANSNSSITSCANYGDVTGTEYAVGGMVGILDSGTIQNSANYGDITGAYDVGNLIGLAKKCNLNNVLGTGNVTATSYTECGGLLVGNISNSSNTASGILAYNSSAKLTINGSVQTGDAVKAIGQGSLTSAKKIQAFSAEQLKSGLVAYILQDFNYHWSSAKGQLILDYVEYFKSLAEYCRYRI